MNRHSVYLLAGLILLGCSSAPAEIYLDGAGRLHVENEVLYQEVSITRTRSGLVNGVRMASATVESQVGQENNLQYRFRWVNQEGEVLAEQPWQSLRLDGHQRTQIKAVAPSKQLERFSVHIRPIY